MPATTMRMRRTWYIPRRRLLMVLQPAISLSPLPMMMTMPSTTNISATMQSSVSGCPVTVCIIIYDGIGLRFGCKYKHYPQDEASVGTKKETEHRERDCNWLCHTPFMLPLGMRTFLLSLSLSAGYHSRGKLSSRSFFVGVFLSLLVFYGIQHLVFCRFSLFFRGMYASIIVFLHNSCG